MKNKYIYIIAALAVVLLLICIEIRHQTDLQRIDALTRQNQALQQDIADLESTIDELLQNMQQLYSAVCASRGRWGGWEGGNRCLHTLAYFQE